MYDLSHVFHVFNKSKPPAEPPHVPFLNFPQAGGEMRRTRRWRWQSALDSHVIAVVVAVGGVQLGVDHGEGGAGGGVGGRAGAGAQGEGAVVAVGTVVVVAALWHYHHRWWWWRWWRCWWWWRSESPVEDRPVGCPHTPVLLHLIPLLLLLLLPTAIQLLQGVEVKGQVLHQCGGLAASPPLTPSHLAGGDGGGGGVDDVVGLGEGDGGDGVQGGGEVGHGGG